MNRDRARWLGVGGNAGLVARCGFLLAWMVVGCVPVSLISYISHGTQGVIASAAAALCCFAGAIPPLALARIFPGHEYTLHHIGFGMLFRMGVPLVVGLLSQVQHWALADAGFLLALVAYFWIGLIFDTLSMLSAVGARTKSTTGLG